MHQLLWVITNGYQFKTFLTYILTEVLSIAENYKCLLDVKVVISKTYREMVKKRKNTDII